MHKEQAINLGEELVEDQRSIAAVVGSSIWCAPILLGWYLLGAIYPDAAGVFILLSGFLIGYAIAIHGRPVTRPFQFAAIGSYLSLIYFSAITGMLYYGSASLVTISAMFLAGIVTTGAMARRSLTSVQKKAIWRYAIEQHSSKKPWLHSYSFLFGASLLGSATVCSITVLLLTAIGL
jgi:hypothetical protein